MLLQKMKYKFNDIIHTYICAVDSIHHGGEYTLCGNAIPDTTMKNDDCQHIGEEFQGELKNITCPNCIRFINFIKNFE